MGIASLLSDLASELGFALSVVLILAAVICAVHAWRNR